MDRTKTNVNFPTSAELGTNCSNCDNCIASLKAQFAPLTEWQQYIWNISLQVQAPFPKPAKTRAPRRKGLRRTERRKFVLDDLRTFRYRHWITHHSRCSWGPESLIPDKTMAFLATNGGLRTMDDLRTALPDWGFRESIGEKVLARMEDADDRWYLSEGKINPNKITKVVETKREAADRYNANKREKRRKIREEEEENKPNSLDVRAFVPGTRHFAATTSEILPTPVSLPLSSQPQSPAHLPAQTPLSSSQTLNWTAPLSGLKPKVVRKRRAPNKPKEDASTSTKPSASRAKKSGANPPVASSSKVQIDDQEGLSTSQTPYSEPTASDDRLEDIPVQAIQKPDPPRPRPQPRPRTKITFDYHMRL